MHCNINLDTGRDQLEQQHIVAQSVLIISRKSSHNWTRYPAIKRNIILFQMPLLPVSCWIYKRSFRSRIWTDHQTRINWTHLINTHTVNTVQAIPIAANTSGTNAHGLFQSITWGVNLSQSLFFSFGAQPGGQVMQVSLSTYESSRHRKHDQQHWS